MSIPRLAAPDAGVAIVDAAPSVNTTDDALAIYVPAIPEIAVTSN